MCERICDIIELFASWPSEFIECRYLSRIHTEPQFVFLERVVYALVAYCLRVQNVFHRNEIYFRRHCTSQPQRGSQVVAEEFRSVRAFNPDRVDPELNSLRDHCRDEFGLGIAATLNVPNDCASEFIPRTCAAYGEVRFRVRYISEVPYTDCWSWVQGDKFRARGQNMSINHRFGDFDFRFYQCGNAKLLACESQRRCSLKTF